MRVERTFEVTAPPERVWEFIVDPENRARAISVVEDYTVSGDGRRATWHVELPIPFVNKTVPIETEDITRRAPEYVKFRGESKPLTVTGEHEIVSTEEGCRLENTFVVDGRLPGVEHFFKRNLDTELANLEAALRAELEDTS